MPPSPDGSIDASPFPSSEYRRRGSADRRARWLALILFLALVKLVVFVFDSNPQVFLGDSMSYLNTAMNEWIPPDRSFLYGFVMHDLTSRARSLSSLVAAQSFAGVLTALLLAVLLVRYFRVPFAAAAAAAVFLAIEPQQLLYERFLLTEAFSTAIFTLFLLLALEYVQTRGAAPLAGIQLAGFLLVAFRVTYVPMLTVATVLAPVLAWSPYLRKGMDPAVRRQGLLRCGMHLAAGLLLFTALQNSYKQWNGSLSKRPPAYTYVDGFFLLTNVSPLVTPADTDNPALREVLAQPLLYGAAPDAYNSRNAEMFLDDGLVSRIKKTFGDEHAANVEARRIAYRVIARDPLGFAGLALQTYTKFWSRDYMRRVLDDESGMRELGPDELRMLAAYHLDAATLPFMKTLTRQYYLSAWPYYLLLLHTPLVMAAAWILAPRGARTALLLVLALAAVHVSLVQAAGVEPSPRHLHAVAVFLGIGLLAILRGAWDRLR